MRHFSVFREDLNGYKIGGFRDGFNGSLRL